MTAQQLVDKLKKNIGPCQRSIQAVIKACAADCRSTLELGSMFGHMIGSSPTPVRLGVEIHRPYVEIAAKKYPGVMFFNTDARVFVRSMLPRSIDLVIMTDFIEHFVMEQAQWLVNQAKNIARKRVFVFVPLGIHEQTEDPWKMGADEYQRHRSTWSVDILESHGFQVGVLEDFWIPRAGRTINGDAAFAIWET